MSAQAGLWNFDGKSVDEDFFGKLSLAIESYGPDGGNNFIKGSIAMVYRAFHTTQESHFERQPYISPRGNVITWDGRLDNRDELLSQLREELTVDQTDVAIVAAAFERSGTDCFSALIGDWALSLWNPRDQTLLLARDFIGMRQLYYHMTPERVVWCTSLEKLVRLLPTSLTINGHYIAGYLAMWPEAHLTPYNEIQAVRPGNFAQVRARATKLHSYWAFDPKCTINYRTDAEYQEHFRYVFRQAVSCRLRSNSTLLAELSGGLDSSAIVCMADDILAHCDAQAQRVDTLSMYNSAQRSCDERPYFLRVEEQRCRAGHHFDLSKYETTLHLEPLNLMSVPSFHGEADLQRSVQQLRRNRGYRVVLSGIGGDEFLGGVPDPRAQLADLLVQLRLSQFAGELKAWSLAKRRPLIQLLGQTLLVLMPRLLRTRIGQERRLANWIDGEFARSTQLGLRQLGPLGRFGFWLPSRRECARTVELMRFQMNYIHSASVALEERRFPYLDRNLIEFLFSIPANQISRPGERRSLMRRSLGGIVPAEVLERKTKAFGTYRSMKFIEERYEEICSLFDSPASEKCGYIDHVRFCQALLDAKNGDAPQLLRIIRVIFLEVWLNNLERHGIFKAVPRRSLRKNLAPVEAEGWSG